MTESSTDPQTAMVDIVRRSAATVAENLAIDEQMTREAGESGRRAFRLWWGGPTAVVLGCSDKPEQCADLEECERLGVQVLKRVTGGGTVVQTSGVLNYSLTMPNSGRYDMREAFSLGAEILIRTLARLGVDACQRGISDVAVGDRKISGNAQARKWRGTLLHGTLLVDTDLELLDRLLKHPLREPDYRLGRSHLDFVTTLALLGVRTGRDEVENAMVAVVRQMGL